LRVATGSVGMRFNVDDAGDFRIVNDGSSNLTFISGASSEVMRIDSSGNVGIGTTSPSAPLQVKANGTAIALQPTSDTDNSIILFRNAADTANAGAMYYDHTNDAMVFWTNGSTERMRIDSSGNVGIGTSSPSALIHASGAAASGGAVEIRLEDTAASSNSRLMRTGSAYSYAGVGANETWLYHAGAGTINIGPDGAGAVKIVNNGSERMRIDSSGNLLVGTTTTNISNSSSATGTVVNAGGWFEAAYTNIVSYLNRIGSDGDIVSFRKDGAAVGSIGTSGNLLVIGDSDCGIAFEDGTTNHLYPWNVSGGAVNDGNINLGAASARFKDLHLSGSIEIENGTGNVGVGKNALAVNTADYNTAVGWYAGNAVTGGYNTFVGAYSGGLVSSGTNNTILGRFSGNQSGLDIRTSSNNIVLSDGDGNPRLYINSSGNAFLGTTSSLFTGNHMLEIYTSNATGDSGIVIKHRDATGVTNVNAQLFVNNAGSAVGSIKMNSSSTSYNTSSDHRLKENVVELTGATNRLKQLEPKRFNFTADADTTVDGFLAHEVSSVVPEAITGTKDEVDADGNPVYQGIDQSKLVPLLVATIKELEARITALENA